MHRHTMATRPVGALAAKAAALAVAALMTVPAASARPMLSTPAASARATPPSQPTPAADARSMTPHNVAADLEPAATHVVVRVRVPGLADDSRGSATVDERAVATVQDQLIAELAGTETRLVRRFDDAPFIALAVDEPGRRVLSNSKLVVSVRPDKLSWPSLAESTQVIGADALRTSGLDGDGTVVAVLDSGVDRYHPFVHWAVVEEACYSSSSDCPNGTTEQTGFGSGAPCTFSDRCDHGTHVAGIAAGRSSDLYGVAPAAGVFAVQVFSEVDCPEGQLRAHGSEGQLRAHGSDGQLRAHGSDGQLRAHGSDGRASSCIAAHENDVGAALERVYDRRHVHRFAAVNLSLGAGEYSDAAECDDVGSLVVWYVDRLVAAGIAVVASSGNDGFTAGISWPACMSNVVSVGATTKADEIWMGNTYSSNSGALLDLLAPGHRITSSVPGGDYEEKTGTSASAPHVAGAFALLKSVAPEASVHELLGHLKRTGLWITDPRNQVRAPRIDVSAAVESLGTLRVSDPKVAEGDNSHAAFGITLAKSEPHWVVVDYATQDGSAKAPGDYAARSGRLYFAPGQTAKIVMVTLADDEVTEGIEQFSLRLTSYGGANSSKPVGTATIAASDRPSYGGPGRTYDGGDGKFTP